MGDRITLIAGEVGDISLATSPSIQSGTALLTGLFGVDGVNIGTDESGDALQFPVVMEEGLPGVYYAPVVITDIGSYFAKFSVDGIVFGPVVIVVAHSANLAYDVVVGVSSTILIVAPAKPSSVQVTMTDREGASIGEASDGEVYTWPQPALQVSGHEDCWYFDDVSFDEGGRVHVALVSTSGPIWNDVIVVYENPQGSVSYFDGWQPSSAYSPADWISLGMIRRFTGWSASTVTDRAIRELRRMAIETFIERTGRWIPPWSGTWHGLRGQGQRLYLPVPVLTTQDGASVNPTLTVTMMHGSQSDVQTIDAENLAWFTRGANSRQPYVVKYGDTWDPQYTVKISGQFGSVGTVSRMPSRIQQCIVGLIRWHSLSYGVGPDEARDAATLNRIVSESSRDRSASYHETAISTGITGDPVIDRILAEYTIQPGPWARRCGDL